MNPIYKFTITVGETERQVYPNYKDDVSKDYELETGQRFFRSKISSKFTFQRDDFDYLDSQDFETEFIFKVYKSDDKGKAWTEYWVGKFMKTDCQWNEDDKQAIVSPDTLDQYNDVLAGLEKEYNLIKLSPAKTPVRIQKRPLIQLYVPGDSVVSCFLSGNYWEQDTAFEVTDTTLLTKPTDEGGYAFALASTMYKVNVTGSGTPIKCLGDYVGESETTFYGKNLTDAVDDVYKISEIFGYMRCYVIYDSSLPKNSDDIGSLYQDSNGNKWAISFVSSNISVVASGHTNALPSSGNLTWISGGNDQNNINYTVRADNSGDYYHYDIIRTNDDITFFTSQYYSSPVTSGDITFIPIYGYGEGALFGYRFSPIQVYMRYLLDVDTISGYNTQDIPADDIVENNRNYHKVIGHAIDQVSITANASSAPTEYGIMDDGTYFDEPAGFPSYYKYFPVARSTWGLSSMWFNFDLFDWILEEQGRKAYTMKDSVLISDVIKVLLNEVAPDISHDGTSEYSQFLYGTNPITYGQFRVMITQKSNILAGEYDRPAQKAPITLTQVFNMLRDCFKCYWYIEDNKLKIEHIKFFRNGGSYSTSSNISVDLTQYENVRNGKKWGFNSSLYDFDKIDMPERYQFEWMDDVTESFAGFPIQVLSKYVTAGKIETVSVSNFTTDIDYMLLNPGSISEDGFALMAANINDTNLFDSNDVDIALGYYVNYQTGNLVSNSNYNATGFIPVKELTKYTMSYVRLFSWYDSDKNYISGINSDNQPGFPLTWESPENAAYLRCSVNLINWDTFIVLEGISLNGFYELPFISRTLDGADLILQNGYLSWIYLHPNYYTYDLPASNVTINDQTSYAYGIDRKKKQTVQFPAVDDIDPFKLIKTNLGNGWVDKISINLHSRMNKVTLKYDTE